jgi:hypothetical protein
LTAIPPVRLGKDSGKGQSYSQGSCLLGFLLLFFFFFFFFFFLQDL